MDEMDAVMDGDLEYSSSITYRKRPLPTDAVDEDDVAKRRCGEVPGTLVKDISFDTTDRVGNQLDSAQSPNLDQDNATNFAAEVETLNAGSASQQFVPGEIDAECDVCFGMVSLFEFAHDVNLHHEDHCDHNISSYKYPGHQGRAGEHHCAR